MNMEYRFLGKTGLRVSPLCLGCMTFEPGGVDEKTAHAMLNAYVEAGGNFIDMADNYPGVEEVFGRWLKKRGDRRLFVIASKVRFPVGQGPNDVGLSRKHILDSLDATLRKTGAEYIDLYQCHCWDPCTPIEETLRTLDDAVRAGKVRYIGCSNFTGWHIMKAFAESEKRGWVRFEAVQSQYSLLIRSPEWEIIPVCKEHGIAVNAWSPLAAGWLTGKYSRDKPPPTGSRMARIAKTPEEWEKILQMDVGSQIPHPTKVQSERKFRELSHTHESERRFRIIDAVGEVARTHGATHGQVALAWLLTQPGICCAVIGASSLDQLNENFCFDRVQLSEKEKEWLLTVSDPGLPYPHDFFAKYGIWR
ncbi:MAG: aldo/keto reductase [Chitinivibrionales bacterium]|nr:aldo/keto reductase [Chitinivibrionales bacterium]